MRRLSAGLLALALLAWAVAGLWPSSAPADGCDDCEKNCRKVADDCREAAPDKLCDMPGMKSVCWMFQNFQCQAAKRYCLSVDCATRPSCGPGPGPGPGGGGGEPHMMTFDQVSYDFQAAGEFVLARHEPDGLEVQARLRPYNARASVISLASIRFGGHILTVRRMKKTSGPPGLSIDGEATQVGEDGIYIATGLGVRRHGRRFMVTAGPHAIVVVPTDSSLDIRIFPGAESKGQWAGLLGDFDGSTDNDFKTRDGDVIERSEMSPKVLYGQFGNSWRLIEGESFLPYTEGESSAGFTDLDFPPSISP